MNQWQVVVHKLMDILQLVDNNLQNDRFYRVRFGVLNLGFFRLAGKVCHAIKSDFKKIIRPEQPRVYFGHCLGGITRQADFCGI